MILGKKLRLRAIEHSDLPLLVQWRNDPEIYNNFYEHEPLSLAMQQKWFEKYLQRSDEKFWIVETIDELRPIGTIALVDIDLRNRKAEIGRVLVASKEDRKNGFGRELLHLASRYSFNHLNLNRIYLEVFSDNVAAVEFYKKFGFTWEGCFRSHIYSQGSYRDVLVLSMLKDEYQNISVV